MVASPRLSLAVLLLSTVCTLVAPLPASSFTAPSLPFVWKTLDKKPTVLFSHRGEKILYPEHSLAGYHVAAVLGADYVEPDLVLTKDGVLVCMHDLDLSGTTNVADLPQFASRKKTLTAMMYGKMTTVKDTWFVHDFTLEELKQIRLVQPPKGIRPAPLLDGHLKVPTFEEVLQLIAGLEKKLNRTLKISPEIKHAEFHNKLFGEHYIETTVLNMLEKYGYPKRSEADAKPPASRPWTRVLIQTFERETAKYLKSVCTHDISFLVDLDWAALTPKGLDEVATFATAVSPWKEVLNAKIGNEGYMKSANEPVDEAKLKALGGWIKPQNLVYQVHKRGLRLVVYTYYDSREMQGDRKAELFEAMARGVDGLFIENVAQATQIRQEFLLKTELTGAY